MKHEAALKSDFSRIFAQKAPHFVSLTFGTAGAPDRAITGNGHTTHWEFKHATPSFDSPGRQELVCMRLAVAGHCRYVLWQEDLDGYKRTLIVHPLVIHNRRGWEFESEAWTHEFDHHWLVARVLEAHHA